MVIIGWHVLGIPDNSRGCLFDLDGKPREDGTRSFLQAGGIDLPEGSDSDAPGTSIIAGLSSQENQIVDALAGVAAGRPGYFGFVVGVDRAGQADALRDAGADIVVRDLAELLDER